MKNKHHIDRIVKSCRAYPVKWIYLWNSEILFDEADAAYRRLERQYKVEHGIVNVGLAAHMAILCLITHEESSYMLDASLDELRLLVKLGDDRALLMFPTCNILKEIG